MRFYQRASMALLAWAFVAAIPAHVQAQATSGDDWPSRSVSILVPTAAGGNTDLMARLAAEYLNQKLGQPFVVQNRPSAGGVLTTGQVATADPDGYTLLFAPSSTVLLTPRVQALQFDPEKLLTPVTNVGTAMQVVGIKRSLPATTLAEFLDYAKANPGKLNFAVAGVNNIGHLGPVLMFKRAGVDLAMVVERGEPQAAMDLTSGSIDFYFGNASVMLNADLTKIRLLAVGSAGRLAAAPDVPTVAETMPDFVFGSWNGFFVPTGTPDAIVNRLRDTITELARQEDMKRRLVSLGIVPGGESKEEVVATFNADRRRIIEALNAAGIAKPRE